MSARAFQRRFDAAVRQERKRYWRIRAAAMQAAAAAGVKGDLNVIAQLAVDQNQSERDKQLTRAINIRSKGSPLVRLKPRDKGLKPRKTVAKR